MNKGVYTAFISIIAAQALKIPIHYVKSSQWNWKMLFQTGGMPSSHSAGVASLTTFIGLKKGIPAIEFALSLIFGLIVMYDAQGIRRQTGELTLKVNDLDELIRKIHEKDPVAVEQTSHTRLKEMLGHQPEEVLGGALLGSAIGWMGHNLSKKDRKNRRFKVR
ncbi:divergent PAP2 family protein [Falsibacillus albus]|uniref:Divergent PAP2 family protein n=1 Tax=Falsibacillus albus TaxID=2478915 RepID=A0A3L7JXA8_9BACI|nr:divergent PAP2 family protein [Falsibacillus albus]RLQ95160.1 divergent PAP2 family protein [Falsibacillus albus]